MSPRFLLACRLLPLLFFLPPACSREPEERVSAEAGSAGALETPAPEAPPEPAADPVVDPTPGPRRVVWRGRFEDRVVELVAESHDGRVWSLEPGPGSEWAVVRPSLRGGRLEFLLQEGEGLRSRTLRFLGSYEPGAQALEGRLLDGARTHTLRLVRDSG